MIQVAIPSVVTVEGLLLPAAWPTWTDEQCTDWLSGQSDEHILRLVTAASAELVRRGLPVSQ